MEKSKLKIYKQSGAERLLKIIKHKLEDYEVKNIKNK